MVAGGDVVDLLRRRGPATARTNCQEAEEDSAPEKEAVDERHDLFVYGHLPTTFGVVLAGVGIEELVLHPSEPLPSAYGWLLASGLGLFLARGGDDPRRHPAQLAGGVALAAGGACRWCWPSPWCRPPRLPLTLGYAVVLIALAIGGTWRSRR